MPVLPAKDAGGYVKLLWREGHPAQVKDLETSARPTAPTVWANTPWKREVAAFARWA